MADYLCVQNELRLRDQIKSLQEKLNAVRLCFCDVCIVQN